MSQIIPYSSFTSATNITDFPALKILLHMDDYTAGATTWTDRKSGLVFNLSSGAGLKDANGVYSSAAMTVSSVTGTMPTLSGYAVIVVIGIPIAGSPTTGVSATFGVSPSLAASGVAVDKDTNSLSSSISLSTAVSNGKPSARTTYFDLVDTTSPIIGSANANNYDAAIGTSHGTGTSTDTGQIVLGAALSSGATITALAGSGDERRVRMVALFDFAQPLSLVALEVKTQLAMAACEMARTRELFAGWRNLLGT